MKNTPTPEMTKYAIKKTGIYTLVIEVTQPIRRKRGKLAYHNFSKGFYTYTGSAIGLRSANLSARLNYPGLKPWGFYDEKSATRFISPLK